MNYDEEESSIINQNDLWNSLLDMVCHQAKQKYTKILPFQLLLHLLEKALVEVEKIVQDCLLDTQDEMTESLILVPPGLCSRLGMSHSLWTQKTDYISESARFLFQNLEEIDEGKFDKDHILSLLENNPVFSLKSEKIEVKPELVSDDDEQDFDYNDEGEEQHECSQCDKVFGSKSLLKSHIRIHSVKCKICGKFFKNQENVKTHMRRVHASNDETDAKSDSFTCFYCKQVFADEKAHGQHEREHQGPWECKECNKVLSNKDVFKQHQRDLHSFNNDCICDTCGMSFKNNRYLKDHIRNKHGKLIPCMDCGKEFKPSAFADHRKYIHSILPLERIGCELCEKTFRSKLTLKSHLAIVHGKEVKTVLHCKYCKRKTISEAQMLKHVQAMHFGVKVACPDCSKEFSHKDSMMKHQALVHGKGGRDVLYCDKCPTKFISNAKLKEHVLARHIGFKFKCSCSKSYSRKHKLVKHMKSGKCAGQSTEPVEAQAQI